MKRKKQIRDMTKVVFYIRASTEDQKLSLEAQADDLRRYCQINGYLLEGVFVDSGISGACLLKDRPALQDLLVKLHTSDVAIVLVKDRTRLARDVLVARMIESTVEKLGCKIVSVDGVGNGSSPADDFVKTVVDGASAFQRALIRMNTKAGLAAKKSRGEACGTVPYGYRLASDGARIEPSPEEQLVIARILELRSVGKTMSAIAEVLAKEGINSRGAKPLSATQICRILQKSGEHVLST